MTRSKNAWKARLKLSASASITLILLNACGGGSGGSTAPIAHSDPKACPSSGMPKLPGFCCENGVRTLFDGPCAGPEMAAIPAINGSLTQAATAGTLAADSNQIAAKLAGINPAALSGGASAATADGKISPPVPVTAKEEIAGSDRRNSPNGTNGPSGAGGMSSGGGGMALNSLFSGRTAPAAMASGSPQNVAPGDAAITAKSGSRGGNAGGSSSAGGSGLSWSSLGKGESLGGTNGSVDFAQNEVNPMSSEDPEDYFTKLGLEESLFKVVERRYRTKAMNWASKNFSSTPKSK